MVSTIWSPKASESGDKTTGDSPCPVRDAVFGEVAELSLTVSVPVRRPRAVGVNVTEIWQLASGARVCGAIGQVEVSPKSPEADMLSRVSATICVFFRVMTPRPVFPTAQLPTSKVAGLRV